MDTLRQRIDDASMSRVRVKKKQLLGGRVAGMDKNNPLPGDLGRSPLDSFGSGHPRCGNSRNLSDFYPLFFPMDSLKRGSKRVIFIQMGAYHVRFSHWVSPEIYKFKLITASFMLIKRSGINDAVSEGQRIPCATPDAAGT